MILSGNLLKKLFSKLDFKTLLLVCLTLGLAPFNPPHFYEKTVMLFSGNLVKVIDIFDFFFHGTPWFLLTIKSVIIIKEKRKI